MSYTIKLKTSGGSDSKKYKFDYKPKTNNVDGAESDWLQSGQTIASYVLTPASGLTIANDSITDTSTTVSFYPTATTAGTYKLTCTITTNDATAQTKTACMTFVVEVC